ncbi:MAG: MGMT family protein [Patescibacteria group bacterium]
MFTFTQKVKNIVRKIPKGKVLTYKQVATKAGSPGASRAVGSIMKANFAPDIPCHRVVRSDGGMGGYNRGGVERKRQILLAEGYTFPSKK